MLVPLFLENARKLLPGDIEVFVNYSVFELSGVGQLLARVLRAAADDGVGILPARAHPPLELFQGGRQDENAHAVRVELAHLSRALPVDLENYVCAPRERIRDHFLRGAVVIPMDFRAFEEFAALAHGEERGVVDEVVLAAVYLARARRARRIGNRELQAGILAEDGIDERALAGSRRRGDDEEQPVPLLL